jgi:hypothetical protein
MATPPNPSTGRKPRGPTRRADARWTLSVPEAGRKYYGLGRNASYEAAASGHIPTIKVNGLLRVPVHMIELMLGGPAAAAE